ATAPTHHQTPQHIRMLRVVALRARPISGSLPLRSVPGLGIDARGHADWNPFGVGAPHATPAIAGLTIFEPTPPIRPPDLPRLGAMGHIVPLHHPLRLAEEIALTDQMVDGRLEVGLVSGILPDYFGPFGVDYQSRRAVTMEFVGLLRRVYT